MINDWGIPLVERNVLNQDEIQKFISGFRARKPETQKWLQANLRNYLISDHDDVDTVTTVEPNSPSWLRAAISRGDEVFKVSMSKAFKDQIAHIIDYLDSPQADFDFSRLSVPDAIKKSDLWTKELTKGPVAQEVPGEIEFKKYSDGYRWVKPTSKEALDREGKLMGHCVGSYCERVSGGDTVIYSLRDPKNEPHCTIEVTNGAIEQIKGKQNREVVAKYHEYVQDFLNTSGIELGDGGLGDLTKAGMLEVGGEIMTLKKFQASEKLKVSGDLNLDGTPITSVPSDLKVGGTLYLGGTKITSLPSGLEVAGNLYLSNTPITSLPSGLRVGGDLDLYGTKIAELPDDIEVKGRTMGLEKSKSK